MQLRIQSEIPNFDIKWILWCVSYSVIYPSPVSKANLSIFHCFKLLFLNNLCPLNLQTYYFANSPDIWRSNYKLDFKIFFEFWVRLKTFFCYTYKYVSLTNKTVHRNRNTIGNIEDDIFLFRIRRKTLYYMYNIVFPCMMMSSLTVLVFCLPPDSGMHIFQRQIYF